jgi:tripartite-type tricarboxylate transporter receptor subunit TctC
MIALKRLVLASVAAAEILMASSARAFPERPVTLVCTVPAGGTIDTVARIVAKGLSQSLGQAVVVENRAGAGGNIAAAHVAASPSDGHTLLITSSSTLTINPRIYKSLTFDPQKSFAPVTVAAGFNLVLVVHPKLGVSKLEQFIALLRSQDGTTKYGSSGVGTLPHLAGEMFAMRTNTRSNHIPYRGIAPALNDLLAGHIDYMFDAGTSAPHVKAGTLNALAVVGPERMAELRDVPTLKELGVDDMSAAAGWFGILAPAGTPSATIQRLHQDIAQIVRSEAKAISTVGLEPISSSPEELGAMISEGLLTFRDVVKKANISAQ